MYSETAMDDEEDLVIEDPSAKELSLKLANRIQPPLLKYHGFWDDPRLGVTKSGIKLEPEQSLCIQGVEKTLREGHSNLYIEAPTGWGKTIAVMKLCELMRDGKKPVRALIVVNDLGDLWRWRDEFDKHQPVLGEPGMDVSKYVGVYYGDEKERKPITIVPYPSFVNMTRDGLIGEDSHEIVFLDEGHKSLSELRQESLGKMHAVQIYMSATPAYTREKSLEANAVCAYSCSPQKAEELRMIAPFQQVVIIQPKVELNSDVILTSGKFNNAALRYEFKRAHVTQSFVNFYKNWKYENGDAILGRQGIVNCLSVDHAKDVAEEINETFKNDFTGLIPAVALDGSTPTALRRWAVDEYKKGNILMLCGDELFVHGFDAPNVDFVFNMSPSTSGVRVGQRGGRARRKDRTGLNPNKIAVIADILYENTSPRGWQLLYAEWMQSRLFERGEDFFMFDSGRSTPKEPKEKGTNFDWSKVGADTIFDKADKIEDLIAWRERKWSELRPAPLWTTRFPLVWQRMKDMGLKTGTQFSAHIGKADPEISLPKLINVLQGVVTHFNPERYVDNWHADALRLSKVLNCHVSRLFPIPDDWQGPRMNTPERREYLQQREKFLKLSKKAGYSTLREFSQSVGMTVTYLNDTLSNKRTRYKDKHGEWSEASRKVAEGFGLSPEELFGAPEGLKEAKRQWRLASQSAPALVPDPEDPHYNGNAGNASLQKEHELINLQRSLSKVLLKLSARNHFVLAMRFGLGGLDREYTLDEVANKMEVTRERVRQMEQKGLRILKHPVYSNQLRGYVDLFDNKPPERRVRERFPEPDLG